ERAARILLRPRAFDLLVALVDRAGHLVTKDELLDRVWPGVVIEEAALHVQVLALRKILGNEAIATVSGQGYRFALPVTKVESRARRRLRQNERRMADVRRTLGEGAFERAWSEGEAMTLDDAVRYGLQDLAPPRGSSRDLRVKPT